MRYIVFDIETKTADIHDFPSLEIAVLVAYDSETDEYTHYLEEDLPKLWPLIEHADALVGYNSDHFDIPILNKYYPGELTNIKSIDLMKTIQEALGRRLKLDNVASTTLGLGKSSDGLQAIRWWKDGEVQKVIDYCTQDVKVTKDLYEHMRDTKQISYKDGPDVKKITLDTSNWDEDHDGVMTHTLGI